MNLEVKGKDSALFAFADKQVMGRAAVNLIRDNFFRLNSKRHRGFTTTGFYALAAQATDFEEIKDGVQITVSKVGIAQRFYGGEIKAKNAKYLTIPNPEVPATLTHRAGEFKNLRFVRFGKGEDAPAALVEDEKGSATYQGKRVKGQPKKYKQQPRVFYWLKRSVQQDADPSVIPALQKIEEAVAEALEANIQQKLKELKLPTPQINITT